jgi:ATP-dependent RNA helicase DeaD
MGFIDDVKDIIASCPKERQTLCFSATMPKEIINLANSQLKDPKHICLAEKGIKHVDIHQRLFVMKEGEKLEGLLRLIATDAPDRAIVFCKTRRNTDELAQKLISRGQNARALHGDLAMEARLKAVKDFTSGDLKIMVATDVASRGLDINNVTHVYNFHLAENTDRYTHRIGRTGRAGNKGVATTFATIADIRKAPFFRSHPYEKFDLSVVPNSKEFFDAVSQVQYHEVMENEPTKKALKIAKRLLSSNDPEQVLAKYITELHKSIVFEGNEKIGFGPDEIKSELKFLSSRGPKKRLRGIPTKNGRGGDRGGRFDRNGRGSRNERSGSRKSSTMKVRGDRKAGKPRRERRA